MSTRGKTGDVKRYPSATVSLIFRDVVEAIGPGERYTRTEFRKQLAIATPGRAKDGASLRKEDAIAMEAAFNRTVMPISYGKGQFCMPTQAIALVEHHLFRLPAGRLNLADIMQLVPMLAECHTIGRGGLTPTLHEKLVKFQRALRSLDLPQEGELERI